MVDQREYWNRVADRKTFTHPLNADWLSRWVAPSARTMDFGCGYGRTLSELATRGYTNTVGVDFSAGMVERGRRDHPTPNMRTIDDLPLADADASYDLVLLLAVLTCIPDDREQELLIAELRRLLRPGGLLYVSDMPLQRDARNLARYAQAEPLFSMYGVFETDDGAIVRHHSPARFAALFGSFEQLAEAAMPLTTMNGNAATGRQILVRVPTG